MVDEANVSQRVRLALDTGLAVPVAAALYSAAEQGRVRWAIGTAAGLLLVSTIVQIVEGDDLAHVLGFEFAGSAGLMACVVALGDSVRARRLWRVELARQAGSAAVEREREAVRRVEEERLRIARELHDVLAHTVSVISLHTDVARESLRDDPPRAQRSLIAARSACAGATQELRATVGALRADPNGAPVPGLAELDVLVANAESTGVSVRTNVIGDVTALPATVDATAYRVVQEALSNVLRHSGAGRVELGIDHDDARLRLRINDDGKGSTSVPSESGWGLIGMTERLGLLGGTLRTESLEGGGFLVEAHIPVKGQT